jgi:hypothetical protein
LVVLKAIKKSSVELISNIQMDNLSLLVGCLPLIKIDSNQ